MITAGFCVIELSRRVRPDRSECVVDARNGSALFVPPPPDDELLLHWPASAVASIGLALASTSLCGLNMHTREYLNPPPPPSVGKCSAPNRGSPGTASGCGSRDRKPRLDRRRVRREEAKLRLDRSDPGDPGVGTTVALRMRTATLAARATPPATVVASGGSKP